MDQISELIKNLNYYIQSLNHPSVIQYFASNICPIISTFAIILGGCFALYKYFQEKNYSINLKILNEVYVPLYSYLVKQETFRYIACPEATWQENPILVINSTKTTRTINETGLSQEQVTNGVCGCTRDAFLALNRKTNMGLASNNLVTLLNTYEMLVHITTGNVITEQKARAVLLQLKVEIELRKEILKGYKYYHKKLKLRDASSNFLNITDEQIEFLPQFTSEEIAREMEKLRNKC